MGTTALKFFDCNTCIGRPAALPPLADTVRMDHTAEQLIEALDRAGIEGALVWHVAQRDYDARAGNDLVARAIAPHGRLAGCWSILPPQTGELGDLDAFFAAAGRAGVRAVRAFPQAHRYLFRAEVLRPVLDRLVAARMPLIVSLEQTSWDDLYDLLADEPELTVILTGMGCWGTDRYLRPLFEQYPNVVVDVSSYIVDGGIEAVVADYGPGRLVFGTGFPLAYHGSAMLMVAHAEIPPEAKEAIASGNLERMMAGVRP
ncbi:MAG TPA: amidohydrolase family protein [Phycisphaerae bacterium]|nr:amidohydrolase family protein [Phycisphaerae bacterium]